LIHGEAEVILDGKVFHLTAGRSMYIPAGHKHRLRNPSTTELLEIVEVQVGTYFGEDDIIRYEDDYKRT
jgi:mannose-1-phosphate guanylyltransferase/mannose-1-phosphate guanylyltransferase/mannose-6-phosphate isomerase